MNSRAAEPHLRMDGASKRWPSRPGRLAQRATTADGANPGEDPDESHDLLAPRAIRWRGGQGGRRRSPRRRCPQGGDPTRRRPRAGGRSLGSERTERVAAGGGEDAAGGGEDAPPTAAPRGDVGVASGGDAPAARSWGGGGGR
jgi:hypothetical protein